MATLYLDRAQLELRVDGRALAMYEQGKRTGTVALNLLDRVVIVGRQTRFESGVLTKIAETGAGMIFLSARNSRQIALVLGPSHNDASIRLAQGARARDPEFCAQWAKDLVVTKLRRQSQVLQDCLVQRPDARFPLTKAGSVIERLLADLREENSPGSDRVRGLEGAAARAYFTGLTAVFPDSLGFTGRNRRPPRDPVNACLSLAYTLLHFDAVRAAHSAGLDPLIGFYHRPSHGRESLASDLIEPLRPKVDAWVWTLFREDVLRANHFSQEGDACLLGKAGRQRFYGTWEGFSRTLRRWLRLQTQSMARSLRAEGEIWLENNMTEEAEV